MRLIDADALMKWLSGYGKMDELFVGYLESVIEAQPTIEPTLYGYNIDHLSLIAKVMEEKGITADKAAEIFVDARAVVQMVLDEQKKAIDAKVKRWMT